MSYLRSLLALAVFLSFVSMLSPMKESVKRACLSAFSIIFLLALVPKNVDFSFKDLIRVSEKGSYETEEVYHETFREGIEEGILKDLSSRFSLEQEELTLESRVTYAENEINISYITLTLRGKNIAADVPGMVRYIEKNYGCDSSVHIVK